MTDVTTNDLTNVDIAPTGIQITSGATPTTFDPAVRYYEITSGGTGGVEIINLPRLSGDIGGYANAKQIAQRVTITLKTQTDPADRVKIQEGGFDHINCHPFYGLPTAFGPTGLPDLFLDYEGATVSFIWCVDVWLMDLSGADGNYTVDGDITVAISCNQLNLVDPPTSDPGVTGRVWNDAGTLKVSAG